MWRNEACYKNLQWYKLVVDSLDSFHFKQAISNPKYNTKELAAWECKQNYNKFLFFMFLEGFLDFVL